MPPISAACWWPCQSGYRPGDVLPPTSLVAVLLTPLLALFLRRKMNAPAAAATAMAPTATPAPMPAFAPVERPLGGGAEEAVTGDVMLLDAVGVETDVCVAVGSPNVALATFVKSAVTRGQTVIYLGPRAYRPSLPGGVDIGERRRVRPKWGRVAQVVDAEVKPALQIFVAGELQRDLRRRIACIRSVLLFLFCIALAAPGEQEGRGEIALVRDIDSVEVVEFQPLLVRVEEADRVVS